VLATAQGQAPWGNLHLATVMFRRVAQLRAGARSRIDRVDHKDLRVAFLEVMAGAVPAWITTEAPRQP
jgi:DNA-directed RNA polymerase subunit K/omega